MTLYLRVVNTNPTTVVNINPTTLVNINPTTVVNINPTTVVNINPTTLVNIDRPLTNIDSIMKHMAFFPLCYNVFHITTERA